MSCEQGYVFIYQDRYKSNLIGACKIEINAMSMIEFQAMTDEEYEYPIQIVNPLVPGQGAKLRIVGLYSTDPQLVYNNQHGKLKNWYELKPIRNGVQVIEVCIQASQEGKNKARVHLVDINSHELIKSYIFIINAVKPVIK